MKGKGVTTIPHPPFKFQSIFPSPTERSTTTNFKDERLRQGVIEAIASSNKKAIHDGSNQAWEFHCTKSDSESLDVEIGETDTPLKNRGGYYVRKSYSL